MERLLTEQLVDVGALALNVASGPQAGPPLLLLHGGSADWRVWVPVADALVEEWHVIAVDLRGHGRSGRGSRYHVADYADDIAAFIGGSLSQPAVIVGHSLGGHVGAAAAAARPELVRAIVVGDAPFDLARLRRHIGASRAQNEGWRDLSASGAAAADIAARLPDVATPLSGGRLGRIADIVPAGSPWYDDMGVNLFRLDPATLDAVIEFEAMHRGLEELLPRVACPILFVQADADLGGLLADEEVGRWLDERRGDRRVRLAGVGHGLFMQAAAPFTRAIRPFLDEIGRGQRA
jgi:pimeloyl-ACP methyl ester carboxylesterase